MKAPCHVCGRTLDRWCDVTYTMDCRLFCGLSCIDAYRREHGYA